MERTAERLEIAREGRNLLMGTLFLFFLWAPVLDFVFHLDKTLPPDENRELASLPNLTPSRKGIESFPAAYEKYYNDHFGFRNWLIRHHNGFKYHVLGVSPNSKKVLLGKDGWLLEATGNLPSLMRNSIPFSATEVETYRQNLERTDLWLKERQIPYLVVYVPELWTVHPEVVPDKYKPIRQESRSDQIIDDLRAQTSVDILDLRPILAEGVKARPLYRKLDPHWNEEGSLVAYQEIMKWLKRFFPEMEPLAEGQLKRWVYDAAGGFCNRALSLPEDLMEATYRVEVASPTVVLVGDAFAHDWKDHQPFDSRTTVKVYEKRAPGAENLPTLLICHDSFGNRFLPEIAEHFHKTFSVRYPALRQEFIEWAQPDVVISLFAERNITPAKVADW